MACDLRPATVKLGDGEPVVSVLTTIRAGAIATAALVATVLCGPVHAANEDEACFEGSVVKVRIADQLFAIPRGYRPFISDVEGNTVSVRRCSSAAQKRLDQPIEAKRFSITAHLSTFEPNKFTIPISGVQVFLSRSWLPKPISRHVFSRVVASVEKSGRTIDELPRVGDFLAFSPAGLEPATFIAAPGTLETPDGYPVTFNCLGPPRARQRTGDTHGRLCSTSYGYSDAVMIQYRFWEGHHPAARWAEIDSAVRVFVRHLQDDDPLSSGDSLHNSSP